jgi:hypothetical protein
MYFPEPVPGNSTTWPKMHNVYKISKYHPPPENGYVAMSKRDRITK